MKIAVALLFQGVLQEHEVSKQVRRICENGTCGIMKGENLTEIQHLTLNFHFSKCPKRNY